MGNSVIWYYPRPDNQPVRIDLGRRVRMRHGPFGVLRITGTESMAGDVVTSWTTGRERVRLDLRWGTLTNTERRVRRQLVGLVNHLQQGGWLAYTEDETYAFATFPAQTPHPGNVNLSAPYNVFGRLGSGIPDLTNRELVLHSDPDTFHHEMLLCSAHSAGSTKVSLPASEGVQHHYAGSSYVFLRELGSHPCLRVPLELRASMEPLTHDREVVGFLDLPLETDVPQLALLYSGGAPLPGSVGGPGALLSGPAWPAPGPQPSGPGGRTGPGTQPLPWWVRT